MKNATTVVIGGLECQVSVRGDGTFYARRQPNLPGNAESVDVRKDMTVLVVSYADVESYYNVVLKHCEGNTQFGYANDYDFGIRYHEMWDLWRMDDFLQKEVKFLLELEEYCKSIA